MNKHVKKRNTKGLRSAQRIRGMSLLLIFCLLMNTVVATPKCEASGDAGSGRQRVFEESGYRLEWSVSSSWETGYVSEVTVVNTGEEELRNWSVVATVSDGDIKNSWNVTHKKTDAGEWIFESETHNRIIQSGERTSFGFMAEGGAYSHLTSMKLVQGKTLGIGDADIQWRETSSWDGHKIMEGTIINKSETSIKDWSLIFDMEGRITNIWNAVVTSEDGGSFHVRNCDYNAVIEAGGSAVFGFEISYDTDSFRGIQNTEIYACVEEGTRVTEPPVETAEPEETEEPEKTQAPEAPKATETPGTVATPAATDAGEEEGGSSEDDMEFIQVENRDWNMDMIHANDPEVAAAKKDVKRAIKVTMLDSGINFSKEVDVAERKNFVKGEDEMIALFEDGSGHGTAIAEVLASNPRAAEEGEPNVDIDEEFGKYTYYGDPEEDDEEEEEVDQDTEEGEVTLADLLDSGYEWTEGVNPNIELYSGKVLDADNETTVDRVVEGIEWAIEKETDILSLSIGMEKDSPKLRRAIQKAASAGMLIIAAVGDDEEVDYPAAYPEVMAVGMADSMGETDSIQSEVAAPGDFIVSRGAFDSMQVFSGSSMAVPHVAGLASILWQKDPSKEADFIRGLIDVSANQQEDSDTCQYGLIDCKYALECYGQFEQQVKADRSILNRVSRNKNPEAVKEALAGEIENDSQVETDEEIEKLHANWRTKDHQAFVSDKYDGSKGKVRKYVDILKSGTSFVDSEENNPSCFSMNKHPWFHGFFGGMKKTDGSGGRYQKSNYMTSYRTLAGLAEEMRKTGKIRKIDPEAESGGDRYITVKNALAGIKEAFKDSKKVGDQTWETLCEYKTENGKSVPREYRSLLIYGMALHTLGDTFAHSSYRPKKKGKKIVWKRLIHDKKEFDADDPEALSYRFEAAQEAVKTALDYIVIDSNGLKRYKSKAMTAEAFCATDVFKKLKEMRVQKKKKPGIPKTTYMKQGFVLQSFSDSYEEEVAVTANHISSLNTYKKFVDCVEVKNYFLRYWQANIKLSQGIGNSMVGAAYYLKVDGETLVTQETTGDQLSFFLCANEDYVIESSGPEGAFTVCTVKKGKVYDEIGRTMTEVEPQDEEEESDEDDVMELCDLNMYERSTDCLFKGKVVLFDDTVGSSSREDMPGLSGVKIRLESRANGKVYKTTTKKDGSYQIQIPAGEYDVTYENGEEFTTLNQFLEATVELYENPTVLLIGQKWFSKGYYDGYIYDQSTGLPLSGVEIQMIEGRGYLEDAPVQTMKTDENGYFSSKYQEAGEYTIVFRKQGYETIGGYAAIIGGYRRFAGNIVMKKGGDVEK